MSHNGSHTRQSTAAVKVAWPFYGAALLVAALVAGTVATLFSNDSLAALGIPDPGPATTFGLPALRGAAWILMSLATGSFLLAAFLVPPRMTGEDLNGARLTVDGHLAARTGAHASAGVALIGLAMIPLVLSDVSGQPLRTVFFEAAAWSQALDQVADARVWLIVAVLAAAVAGFAYAASSWWSQVAAFLGSICVVMPLALTGHSASGGAHDFGTNSLIWHLVAMLLWVGGLMALTAHAMRRGPHLPEATRRYSRIALFAIAVMAVSGVVNALIRVRLADLTQYSYGNVLILKTVGIVVLGVIGFVHRERTIPRLEAEPQAFRRLAAVEVVVALLHLAAGQVRVHRPGRDEVQPTELVDDRLEALEAGDDVAVDVDAADAAHGLGLPARPGEDHRGVELALSVPGDRDPQVAGEAHEARAARAVDPEELDRVGA